MAQIRREREVEVLNASNLEPSKDFRAQNGSNFVRSQKNMHIPTCDICSFDGFFSYLRVPLRVRNFSAKKFKIEEVFELEVCWFTAGNLSHVDFYADL